MKVRGVCAVLVLAGCSVTSSLTGGASSPSGNDRLVMPDLMGKTAEEANAILRSAGFSTEVEVNRRALECVDAAQVPGRINCQDPEPGRPVYRSAIIGVTVFEERKIAGALVRAQLVKVRGMTIADARTYLKSIGHGGDVVLFEQHVWSDACGVGKVCDVAPESGVPIDGQITLVINANATAPTITMPD